MVFLALKRKGISVGIGGFYEINYLKTYFEYHLH